MSTPHALVTGASRGIGAAIVEALVARGVRVSATSRSLADLQARWGVHDHVRFGVCDVTDETSIDAAFTAAETEFGPIAILVNNAGAAETAPFMKTDAALLGRMLDLNVGGVFACTRRALPGMKALERGRIVNIASTAGLTGAAYTTAYTAAKHAVVGMTRALAKELAATSVTVNAVCPSFTDTDLISRSLDMIAGKSGRDRDAILTEMVKPNPQGRLIDPREVADTVAWLAIDAGPSITGQAIAIDGGETA
jgi:NAD(P)-dependent dehydrogenase (short-subunit alcohol dehydrogenase family)